eukprot:TRINITY_DN28774_c0_g1_i4.p1 TRINITY_DN28774_c0_g1~~TRINITY_DN28774_c0_g1_i4.p1  ORF type:complete len:335 (-),score=74.66 TRINITY_DN28774_c0_g1_i4:89-1093(-)
MNSPGEPSLEELERKRQAALEKVEALKADWQQKQVFQDPSDADRAFKQAQDVQTTLLDIECAKLRSKRRQLDAELQETKFATGEEEPSAVLEAQLKELRSKTDSLLWKPRHDDRPPIVDDFAFEVDRTEQAEPGPQPDDYLAALGALERFRAEHGLYSVPGPATNTGWAGYWASENTNRAREEAAAVALAQMEGKRKQLATRARKKQAVEAPPEAVAADGARTERRKAVAEYIFDVVDLQTDSRIAKEHFCWIAERVDELLSEQLRKRLNSNGEVLPDDAWMMTQLLPIFNAVPSGKDRKVDRGDLVDSLCMALPSDVNAFRKLLGHTMKEAPD